MIVLAMLGWPMVVVLLFALIPPRRAAIISFLAGWMFLPDVTFIFPGVPDYHKTTAATVGVVVGAVLFDPKTILSLRPTWGDIPAIVFCIFCPFLSSVTNGLGVYDGVSGIFDKIVSWGFPYILGRAYLRSFEAFRELAVLLFIAGLIYAPLCLFEIRMSPQLNKLVYGFGNETGGGEYATELGSWGSRPRVFMGTGLALGTFMTAASLMGVWLWYTGTIKRVHGYAAGPLALGLVMVAFGCKNMGALCLLLFGLGALFAVKFFNRSWPIYLLIAASPLYIGFRASGNWSADSMVEMASTVHKQRGKSLNGRLINENILAEKALERPAFGWGGWGRARVYDENGKDISVTDGLWIIVLGDNGIVGLTALTATLLLPVFMLVWRYPAHLWCAPTAAPAGAAAVLVVLWMIDNLFNAMFNPVYVMAAAGLISVVACRARINPNPAKRRVYVQSPPSGALAYDHPSI